MKRPIDIDSDLLDQWSDDLSQDALQEELRVYSVTGTMGDPLRALLIELPIDGDLFDRLHDLTDMSVNVPPGETVTLNLTLKYRWGNA